MQHFLRSAKFGKKIKAKEFLNCLLYILHCDTSKNALCVLARLQVLLQLIVIVVNCLSVPYMCLPIKKNFVNFARITCLNLRGFKLADSGSEEEVDMLIVSDFYWDCVSGNATRTPLGIVVIETEVG